jgi:hypothetical protein
VQIGLTLVFSPIPQGGKEVTLQVFIQSFHFGWWCPLLQVCGWSGEPLHEGGSCWLSLLMKELLEVDFLPHLAHGTQGSPPLKVHMTLGAGRV